MAKNEYKVVTRARPASPRSKRPMGVVSPSTNGGGSVTVAVTGENVGHTHENKSLLDALAQDLLGYLYLRFKADGADESTLQKVKAGFADKAKESEVAKNAVQWCGNIFSDYLSQPVRKDDLVEFLEVLADGFKTKNFIPGAETGVGAGINAAGDAEMNSLLLRSFLKVPKLIYNEVQVTGGELWNTPGGTIREVLPDPDSKTSFTLLMDIEDGDSIKFDIDDICKGRYNKNGGFSTTYFRVTSINQAAKTMRVVLGANEEVPGGKNSTPNPHMNVAQYGNFTNVARQNSQYFSSSEQRIVMLGGVDNYIVRPEHYKVVIGNVPSSLIPHNLPTRDKASIYLDNVLARNFFQLGPNNQVIKVVRDRGTWSIQEAQKDPYLCEARYQDEVYHASCKWRCIRQGTQTEPRYDSEDWLLVAGDTTLRLDIESTGGETFLWGHLETTLRARVWRGLSDITMDILPSDWSWTRDTGNAPSDTVWNTEHANATSEIALTNEDLRSVSGRFICEVFVRDGATKIREEVSF